MRIRVVHNLTSDERGFPLSIFRKNVFPEHKGAEPLRAQVWAKATKNPSEPVAS